MRIAERAAPVDMLRAPEPRREPIASAATAPTKLNSPNTANGANATSTRPSRSGQDCGSQIVFTPDSPRTMRETKPIVRGPVRRRTTIAEK